MADRGANLEATDNDGWTPFFQQPGGGQLEVVKALADRGANLEATDDIGWTPIFSAARSGHLEVVKILADRGANLVQRISSNHGFGRQIRIQHNVAYSIGCFKKQRTL